MLNIVVQKLKKRDIPYISKIARTVYLPEYKELKYSTIVIDDLQRRNDIEHLSKRIKGNFFFVAEDKKNSKVVGIIGLRKHGRKHDRISTFAVSQDYQGKGVGSMLFRTVLKLAKKFKLKKLFVKASYKAEPIYHHWGFKKIRIIKKKYSNGDIFRTVWMEKEM